MRFGVAGLSASQHDAAVIAARVVLPCFVAGALALVGAAAVAHVSRTMTAERVLTIVPSPGNRPELVAYRAEGAREWTVLAHATRGYLVRKPAKRFTIAVACARVGDDGDERALVQFFHLAAGDTELLPVTCRDDTRSRVTVPVRFVEPARQLRVGDQSAGVSVDRDGRVVRRDDEVKLPPGLHDWIVMSDKPFRIAVAHDVPPSPARRDLDLRDAERPDRICVSVPGTEWISVEFRSRNGTRFFGLGEPEPGVFEIVPRALREAGDVDVVHADRIYGSEGVAAIASTFASTPPRIALALPTVTPSSRRADDGISWRNAPRVDLVSIEYASEHLLWEVTASARWLAGKTSYAPIDPGAIAGWRWARRAPPASWITWLWTDDPTQLPFDWFDPPPGVTFSRVAEPPR